MGNKNDKDEIGMDIEEDIDIDINHNQNDDGPMIRHNQKHRRLLVRQRIITKKKKEVKKNGGVVLLGKGWDIPSFSVMRQRNQFRRTIQQDTINHRRIVSTITDEGEDTITTATTNEKKEKKRMIK